MFLFLFFFSFSDLTTSTSCGASFSESKICIQRRDPFYVSDSYKKKKISYFVRDPKILGIMSFDGKKTALIDFGDNPEMVKKGDTINGYTIIKIGKKHIIALNANKEETEWFI